MRIINKNILFLAISLFLYTSFTYGQAGGLRLGGTISGSNINLGNTGNAVTLTSISVSPPNQVITYTASQAYTALGTFNNGSQGDLTGVATWSSSNTGIATMSANVAQCVSPGTVTISAVYQGITGTTSLQCQSPTFTPQGTINVVQNSSSITIIQFTAANGTPPYTFSSSNLPGFVSLSNSGCSGNQIDCSLVGAPTTVGVYNFNIQATDNLGNQSCPPPGCAVGLNVTAASAEDNTYCSLVSNVETVVGSPNDPPANAMPTCNYTAIAWTTLGGSPTIINVCPVGELSSGVSVTGCANAPQPSGHTVPNCNTTSGVIYCSMIQSAINYAYNTLSSPCGADIQIWPRIDDGIVTSTQNVYTEPIISPPGNINCGPDYSNNWMYIRTRDYANLPPPGNRISPSWVNVSSIPNYPSFSQTSQFSIAAGIHMPQWRCEVESNEQCSAFSSQMLNTTTGQIFSGVRVIGIQFTAPHGRNTSVDLYGNNICPLNSNNTPQCSPGFEGSEIEIGCETLNTLQCATMSGTQGKPPAAPTGTGSQHFIMDRVIVMGCDDNTMSTCYDDAESLVDMENGQHMSLIDSYVIGAYCMYGIGPCTDSKGTTGGNPINTPCDTGLKLVNNMIVGSGENIFLGGGTAICNPTGIEIRRNHLFKPLTWKADSSVFIGQVYDAFVSNSKTGTGYSSGTTCSIDPPLSGTQATCTPIVGTGGLAGQILDITITNHGSGYGLRTKAKGTYPARPNVYFTDGGTTYTSCANQLSGYVNTNGTTSVAWEGDNKFIPGMVGTNITINGVNYNVASYISNISITTGTAVPTGTALPYTSNLPVRGDCIQLINGTPDVKNLTEFKNGVGAIFEGNIYEDNWVGQSDQSGIGVLLIPRNANNGCPTCSDTDITFRYNFSRNMNHGIEVSDAFATQGGFLPQDVERISIHDNIWDGIDPVYWTAGTSPIPSNGGTCVDIANYQGQLHAPNNIKFNHNECITTVPNGYSLTGGTFFGLLYILEPSPGGPSIMTNITVTNSVGGGGVKQEGFHGTGQTNCLNQSCTDQTGPSGHGPSEVALRQVLQNSYDGPIVSGVYSTNQLGTVTLTNGGTCTTSPTSITISGGGGTGGTAGLTTSGTAVTKAYTINVGQGYTSVPTVVFNGGTCSIAPAATVNIAGANNATGSAACFDHNIMPLKAWNGMIPMTPYPTTQIDTTNTCAYTTGGHNNTTSAGVGYNVCNGVTGSAGTGPCSWADMNFMNFVLDGNGAELVGTTPDLHLNTTSLGYQAGSDSLDIGANVTLVLGCQGGTDPGCSTQTTSQYTGITIQSGVAVLPQ